MKETYCKGYASYHNKDWIVCFNNAIEMLDTGGDSDALAGHTTRTPLNEHSELLQLICNLKVDICSSDSIL